MQLLALSFLLWHSRAIVCLSDIVFVMKRRGKGLTPFIYDEFCDRLLGCHEVRGSQKLQN